ncbi:MAG: nucleotide-binding universal stress UspA family protein [Crocinitomix sp.]|jgi:nucleotide-binding universal stress UspA family protein
MIKSISQEQPIQIKLMKNQLEFNVIYLLTDFSEHAKNASEYAIAAFGTDVSYVLINSYEVRSTAATLINIEQIAHQESMIHLENEAERLIDIYPNLTIEKWSKSGSTVNVINKFMKDYEADLIVAGSKGMSKLDEILIGSTTSSVIRGVDKPVLTIPLGAKFSKMKNIVFGSDLLNINKTENIEFTEVLKDRFNAKISAATVKMDKSELTVEEQSLVSQLSKAEVMDDVSIIRDPDVSKGLMDFCQETSADLLIVVAKHTSFFKRFFHKSITKDLVNHEMLPILVLDDN